MTKPIRIPMKRLVVQTDQLVVNIYPQLFVEYPAEKLPATATPARHWTDSEWETRIRDQIDTYGRNH